MKDVFRAHQVTDTVWWVGAIDWSLRDFHGYATYRGTTYNAFLVIADKVALIDAVKGPFREELMARIASVIDPKKINVIVSNHAEMDHTGCLPQVIAAVEPDHVYASEAGVEALQAHFHDLDGLEAVGDGATIDLGGRTLRFFETKMVHWPDSMLSYMPEEKLLFSQDAFGMHLATGERFADEVPRDVLGSEAAKYFANILMPLIGPISRAIGKVQEAGIELDIIAPDHGPIWRRSEDIDFIVGRYVEWCAQNPTLKAVVVYDTMWGSTDQLAHAIGEGLKAGGAVPKLMPLKGSHRSDIATELLDAGALLVGTPTLNGNMLPTVADALTYIHGLKPKHLVAAAFGSYGWAPAGVKQVQGTLDAMKLNVVGDGLKVRFVPDDDDLKTAYALGTAVAEKVKAACGGA
ncbi:MAG: FprA family A-type flavoprotein [Verrucomicrobia bacterium]|nr:FprA family A-type flavoprotein [Verrucomicrobiota bacterium]